MVRPLKAGPAGDLAADEAFRQAVIPVRDGTEPLARRFSADAVAGAAATATTPPVRPQSPCPSRRPDDPGHDGHEHARSDSAGSTGAPAGSFVREGAHPCRFIEDRFGITGARWSPDGAEVILKLRAVVINGDLDDYMNYYKARYRNQIHLSRYDPDSIASLGLAA